MKEIVARHYNETVLAKALKCYDIPSKEVKCIRDNSNLIFDCGDKILRLTFSGVRPLEEVVKEIDWLIDLKMRGVPVTEVLPSRNGSDYEKIGTDNDFTVVCFEKVRGHVPKEDEWDEDFFERLGAVAGQLLVAGREYLKCTPHNFTPWDEIAEHHCTEYLVSDRYDYRERYATITNRLRARPIDPAGLSLIHYDIHFGNFLVDDATSAIVLFDFEMCCLARPIDEVATAVYYARLHPASKDIENIETVFYRAFKRGFTAYLPISTADEASIPEYLVYRDLLVLGFINDAWGVHAGDEKQLAYRERILARLEVAGPS